MKDAFEYFRANLVDMIAEYEGEYIAIMEDKIVTHGRDVCFPELISPTSVSLQVDFLISITTRISSP
jgi:hypothetical protein